jgi:branched-chain amino acid transport system permease protein
MVSQCGVFHETYASDMQLRPTTWQRIRIILVFLLLAIFPLIAGDRELRIANTILIAAIGAIGLNILVGFTGQISLGQGAFLAVGAYATGLLMSFYGIPWWLSILLAAMITAVFGAFFGIPSLRLKGLYLAVATLAAQQIVAWVVRSWDPIDGEINGFARELNMPHAEIFDVRLNDSESSFYIVAALTLVVVTILATNLFRTHIGRAFIAIRDQDIAASVMGVNVFRYKLLSFSISSFFVGLAGGLTAVHSTNISFERFTIAVSIEYLAMIIIGGLGSVAGAIYGATFIKLLPEILRELGTYITEQGWLSASNFDLYLPFIREAAFGSAIILTLVFEPEGINKVWKDIKAYFRLWPFSY